MELNQSDDEKVQKDTKFPCDGQAVSMVLLSLSDSTNNNKLLITLIIGNSVDR